MRPSEPRFKEQGEALIKLRRATGKSKNEVIDESKISRPIYFDLEKGLRRLTPTHAAKLAPVLGVPIDDLLKLSIKNRMSQEELGVAAEAAMEEATPQEAIHQVKIWLRAEDRTDSELREFLEEMGKIVRDNWDEFKKRS